MALFLIRHGSTELNEDGRLRGWIDVPLSDLGRMQADNLAVYLNDIHFIKGHTSDLIRAAETAETIAARHNRLSIEWTARLRPLNFGTLQGQPLTKIERRLQELYAIWEINPAVRAPGGESFQDFQNRIYPFLQQLLLESEEGDILAVAHTRVCSYAIAVCMNGNRLLNGKEIAMMMRAEVDPGNLVGFKDGNLWKINPVPQIMEPKAEPALTVK